MWHINPKIGQDEIDSEDIFARNGADLSDGACREQPTIPKCLGQDLRAMARGELPWQDENARLLGGARAPMTELVEGFIRSARCHGRGRLIVLLSSC